MSDTQLTRLGDFISGAGSTILLVAIASPRWWIVLAGLLLMAKAIGVYVVQYRRAQSGKSKLRTLASHGSRTEDDSGLTFITASKNILHRITLNIHAHRPA
jgi:hypothetical protein